MGKAGADYARLADNAEILRDGLASRVNRADAEIRKLLKGHPELEKIMQLVDHYAINKGAWVEASESVRRYVALRDRPPADGVPKSS